MVGAKKGSRDEKRCVLHVYTVDGDGQTPTEEWSERMFRQNK